MADTKTSALTALTGAALATGDLIGVVDVSDTSMAASGTNKQMTAGNLVTGILTLGNTDITELIRDTIAAALTAGTGVTVTPNDGADTITLATDAVGFAFYSSGWPARPSYDTVFWISTDRAASTPGAATGTDVVILPTTEVFEFSLSDETTAITTGTAKLTWRTPYAFTVTAVRASLATVSSSGLVTVDINDSGTTIMSTNKLSIDANEKTSTTAATAAGLTDTALADDAEITFDIDAAGTGAKGLKVKIYGYRT